MTRRESENSWVKSLNAFFFSTWVDGSERANAFRGGGGRSAGRIGELVSWGVDSGSEQRHTTCVVLGIVVLFQSKALLIHRIYTYRAQVAYRNLLPGRHMRLT